MEGGGVGGNEGNAGGILEGVALAHRGRIVALESSRGSVRRI